MSRERLSVDDVLAMIERNTSSGKTKRATATRAAHLAISLGAHPRPRHRGVAFRLPGRVDAKPDWLTLFVLSTSGTVYNNWQDRWRTAGVPATAIKRYENVLSM